MEPCGKLAQFVDGLGQNDDIAEEEMYKTLDTLIQTTSEKICVRFFVIVMSVCVCVCEGQEMFKKRFCKINFMDVTTTKKFWVIVQFQKIFKTFVLLK